VVSAPNGPVRIAVIRFKPHVPIDVIRAIMAFHKDTAWIREIGT
jgi:hypothetical protein